MQADRLIESAGQAGTPVCPLRKVVVAMDSFKGCLTTEEANRAVADGVRHVVPDCQVTCFSVADGGEGLLDVQVPDAARRIELVAHGPLMELMNTCYGIGADGQTVYVETARICGLPLVPVQRRNPLYTSSFGVGEVIAHALKRGFRSFVVGLGGSATNDAGLGMLQALGYRFLDVNGAELQIPLCGAQLGDVAVIDSSSALPSLQEATFIVVCDVCSPLCGPCGSSLLFARQKGADDDVVRRLEAGMLHVSHVIERETGLKFADIPGAGAAGGLGGAFAAFCRSTLMEGSRWVLEQQGFDTCVAGADFVITGEGKSDRQTLLGKTPYGVLQVARRHDVPVLLLPGGAEDVPHLLQAGFLGVFPVTPFPATLRQAMCPSVACHNLALMSSQVCRLLLHGWTERW